MWGDRTLGTRERGCMYCELGGDVFGEIGRFGHEKELVSLDIFPAITSCNVEEEII